MVSRIEKTTIAEIFVRRIEISNGRSIMRGLLVGCVGAAMMFVVSGTAESQWSKIKDLGKIPGIDDLLAKEPPLTTSLDDAVTEVAFLDDYHGLGVIPLSSLSRAADGTFILDEPGHYMMESQSYCLKAGTYGPSKGDGYLLAPLKGPWSGIIRNVLRRSVLYPEIPQREIQLLLWAIIARTKIEDMGPESQRVAAKLLEPKELYTVNGGAMGLVPDRVWLAAIASLPPEVRRIREAEADLREALTSGTQTYEEIERVAVLVGEPPPQEGDRVVPGGRWSYHPAGYFIRFRPSGYSRTRVEVHLPAPVEIKRDAEGRITRLVDGHGCTIEIEYDDDRQAGDGPIRAFGFKTVRCEHAAGEAGGETVTTSWAERGWTLVGLPTTDGTVAGIEARFTGVGARYRRALELQEALHTLEGGVRAELVEASAPTLSAEAFETLVNLAHLSQALENVTGTGPDADPKWGDFQAHVIKGAWQWSLVNSFGSARHFPPDERLTIEALRERMARHRSNSSRGIVRAVLRGTPGEVSLAKSEEEEEVDLDEGFDLSPDGAQPGRGGSQRLGESNRGTDMDSTCAGNYSGCKEIAFREYFRECTPVCFMMEVYEEFVDCFDRCTQDYEHYKDYCNKKAQHCLEGGGW